MATGHRAVGAVLSVIVRYVNREPCGKSVIEYMVFCLFASHVRPNYLTGEVVKFERSPHSPLQTTSHQGKPPTVTGGNSLVA